MIMFFEQIEPETNELNQIIKQISFVLNSFAKENEFNGFGVNIWKLNLEKIKEILSKEETRVTFESVYLIDQILIIQIIYQSEKIEIRQYIYQNTNF